MSVQIQLSTYPTCSRLIESTTVTSNESRECKGTVVPVFHADDGDVMWACLACGQVTSTDNSSDDD